MSTKAVDWGLSIQLANGSADIAAELLEMLRTELPEFKNLISSAFNSKDAKNLASHTHKLHGGCCYCGVPQLKSLVRQLETQAKNDPPIFDDEVFNQVMTELDSVINSLNLRDYK